MNHTENYQLTQWEKSDRIMMDDFNDNNAKLDAALAKLDKDAWGLGYYAVQLCLRDFLTAGTNYVGYHGVVVEPFNTFSSGTLTQGLTVSDHALVLKGQQTGTMSNNARTVDHADWTEARLWLHRPIDENGTVDAYLNGEKMEFAGYVADGTSPLGRMSYLHEYRWTGKGKKEAQVTLQLDRKNSSTLTVYDYGLYVR